MRRILVVSVYLFICLAITYSQSRFPIKPNSVWRINYEFSYTPKGQHSNGDEVYKYFVNGDTVINNKTFFKLYKSGIMYLETPLKIENKYMGAIRDSANQIFYIASTKTDEKKLYDFDLKKGDYLPGNPQIQVDSVDTLPDGRKRFQFFLITVHCGSANTIVEGIGWLGGLLEGNSCYSHPGIRGSYAVCYSEGDVTKYLSDIAIQNGYTTCSDVADAIKVIRKKPFNITATDSYLNINSPEKNTTLEIYNLLGNKVVQKTVDGNSRIYINNYKPGVYILKYSSSKYSGIHKFVKN